MKSVEYWKRRAEARMYEELEKAEDTAGMIAKVYAKAARYLMDKADAVFERYQTLEKMTEAQALEMIRSLSKYDDVDEVIRVLEADHSEEAQFLVKRMKNTSAYEFRIKRLGEMLRQVNGLMTSVYGQEMKEVEGVLSEIASDGYLKTMYDIQQRINVGFSVSHIDKKRIAKILNTNWSGMHFSERIWNNTQKLGQTVKEQILLGALTGKTEREMADVIAQEFGKGAGVARRLVRTESCHVASEANAEAYEDAGIEMYLYLATLDLRTSAVCRELDGKRFKVSERQTGENCPPMHPWCRSTTIAIVDEEYLQNMKRTYRDPETGRNEKVPLTMSYDEWYKKYAVKHVENEKAKNSVNKKMLRLAKSGNIFTSKTDKLFEYAQDIKPIEGYEDIVSHGDPYSIVFKDLNGKESSVSAKEFCDIIEKAGTYKGGKIRLIACQTGAGKGIVPTYIAKRFKTEVLAPTEIVNVDFEGNMILADDENDAKMGIETGEWVRFNEKGRIE